MGRFFIRYYFNFHVTKTGIFTIFKNHIDGLKYNLYNCSKN